MLCFYHAPIGLQIFRKKASLLNKLIFVEHIVDNMINHCFHDIISSDLWTITISKPPSCRQRTHPLTNQTYLTLHNVCIPSSLRLWILFPHSSSLGSWVPSREVIFLSLGEITPCPRLSCRLNTWLSMAALGKVKESWYRKSLIDLKIFKFLFRDYLIYLFRAIYLIHRPAVFLLPLHISSIASPSI